jgi:hypothetical protein
MFQFAIRIDIPWPGDSTIWIYLGLFILMLKIIKLIIRIITDTHLPKMKTGWLVRQSIGPSSEHCVIAEGPLILQVLQKPSGNGHEIRLEAVRGRPYCGKMDMGRPTEL